MCVKSYVITMVTVYSKYRDKCNVTSCLSCFFLKSPQNILFNVSISKYLLFDPIQTSLICTNI